MPPFLNFGGSPHSSCPAFPPKGKGVAEVGGLPPRMTRPGKRGAGSPDAGGLSPLPFPPRGLGTIDKMFIPRRRTCCSR